jgi:hypothetical protein
MQHALKTTQNSPILCQNTPTTAQDLAVFQDLAKTAQETRPKPDQRLLKKPKTGQEISQDLPDENCGTTARTIYRHSRIQLPHSSSGGKSMSLTA